MKKIGCFLLAMLLVVCLAACGANSSSSSQAGLPSAGEDPVPAGADDPASGASGASSGTGSQPSSSTHSSAESQSSGAEREQAGTEEQNTLYVKVGGETFSATFADNAGARALQELLAGGEITLQMSDYGGFEKVGPLGQSLPTENSQTTTQAGDIVLYQGDKIVIFYGSNSWSYTRLGSIDDLAGWQEALGSGDVAVTFSLQGE